MKNEENVCTKTYVEFFGEGDEVDVVEVADRVINKLVVPDWAIGFQFYDVEIIEEVQEDGSVIPVSGLVTNRSDTYWEGSREEGYITGEQLRRNLGERLKQGLIMFLNREWD